MSPKGRPGPPSDVQGPWGMVVMEGLCRRWEWFLASPRPLKWQP